MSKAKLGVLISGSGSNLQAIIDRIEAGRLNAEISVVISSKDDAYGLKRAEDHGIKNVSIIKKEYRDSKEFNLAILSELQESKVDLVILAGFMLLIGSEVLSSYPSRVVNLHPALLPSFPGANAITDALDYGVRVTGVTVHFADETYDTGSIILQDFVPVHQNDTEEELARRIHKTEHELLPRAIYLLVEGRVKLVGEKVKILGRNSDQVGLKITG